MSRIRTCPELGPLALAILQFGGYKQTVDTDFIHFQLRKK